MRYIITNLISLLFSLSICFGTVYYVDPVNGSSSNDGSFNSPWKTLEEVIDDGLIESYSYSPLPYQEGVSQLVIKNQGAPIKAGDIIMLRSGLHGELFARGYYNSSYITIMAESGHQPILRNVKLQACRNWKIKGIDVSGEPYGYEGNNKLIFAESHNWQGPASNIEIEGNNLYGAEQAWQTAEDWLSFSKDGIYLRGDSMLCIENNVRNVDMGITLFGDYIQAIDNNIVNFSGDGIRVLGSNCLVKNNLIKNCYDVDENHDDGIQSFTTGGLIVDNNIIESNIILNYEDPNQNLLGPLQGIGCFDGFFNNWIVRNNLVFVNHFHGISFYGANNCEIVNNTVLDPLPDIEPGSVWILVTDHKNGTPSSGCIAKNNVANRFIIDGVETNNVALDNITAYNENFVNYLMHDFSLKQGSVLIDAADDNYAPAFDIVDIPRPQGNNADVGCYEFQNTIWSYCTPFIDLGTGTLTNNTIHAQNEIISSSTVPLGVNVTLKAGQKIRLNNGFNTNADVNIDIRIEGCELE